MIFKNEKQLLKIIKYTPSIFILAISIITFFIQFFENNRTFEIEKQKIKTEFTTRNKEIIKREINELYNYIKREQTKTEKKLKESLKNAVDNAYSIANSIYQNNLDKDPAFIKKLIIDALRDIRFNQGRGYFFVYEKSGKNVLLPHHPQLEGKDFWKHQDAKGAYVIQDMVKLLNNNTESFYEWYWYNPTKPDKQKRKIGLVHDFKPFNWFIGTGEYIDEYEVEVKNNILEYIENIKLHNDGYIFVIDYDFIYLSHIRKDYIGKHATTNNDAVQTKDVMNKLYELAKDGEGFHSYIQNKKPGSEKPTHKVSFVKGLENWSWMLGTGFYEDDMQEAIIQKREELDEKLKEYAYKILEITILLTLILLILSIYFSKILQNKFIKYKKEIQEHIKENNRQQNIVAQKAKMAAMGEMIGNIAHQWRQPLSTISTSATGVKLQKELGVLEDELLLESMTAINDSAQYLSATIDDFRNFFKTNKEEVLFDIKDTIDKALSLCSAHLSCLDINIIKNIESAKIIGYENEFIQVLINIINNSKDELIKKDPGFEKMIFIDVQKKNNHIVIKIKDNAGGIPKKIKNRIFEPYFTTKHQSQGTGIGLFMCKEIIEKNMNGSLEEKNLNYLYKKEYFTGAVFEIKLPIKK